MQLNPKPYPPLPCGAQGHDASCVCTLHHTAALQQLSAPGQQTPSGQVVAVLRHYSIKLSSVLELDSILIDKLADTTPA